MADFNAWTSLLLILLYGLLVISILLVMIYSFQLIINQMMCQKKDMKKNPKSHIRPIQL